MPVTNISIKESIMAKLRELTRENTNEVLETARKVYPAKIKVTSVEYETVNGGVPFSVLDDESKDCVVARIKSRLMKEAIELHRDLKETGQPSKVIEIELAKLIVTDNELNSIVENPFDDVESDII